MKTCYRDRTTTLPNPMNRPPPLETIEAFIEAAHGPSFKVAAARCAISPAAFSRRIQALSQRLGVDLFDRTGEGLRLTEAGKRCLAQLEPAYLELLRAAATASGRRESLQVRLSLSHSLAVGWLIPRLGGLRDVAPDIELSLDTVRDESALRRGSVDLALCFSDSDLSGLASRRLIGVAGGPLASPELARRFRDNPDLAEFPRLSVTVPSGLWEWWTEQAQQPPITATTQFDIMQAAYEAAAQGMGIVLGALPTVEPYLKDGRLVEIGLPWFRYPGQYCLAATPAGRRRRPVATVWSWLEAQARQTPSLRVGVANASLSRSASL
ncbi:LysR family transcriptional regulator [Brevundimonas aurifodinae]|uniref:LysR substrate-binding domain-containing protein n=1 Tax=Brevundimonas aurifodinae TaxID=1508312 RepID=A0ABV1NMB9_9CAUL